jgi:hypothetical protein
LAGLLAKYLLLAALTTSDADADLKLLTPSIGKYGVFPLEPLLLAPFELPIAPALELPIERPPLGAL